MQRAWNPQWIVQLNLKLLQLVSILGFSQSLEIVGYDFENILQTQKESDCQNLWQGHRARLPGLGDFEFNAPKEVLNEMNADRTESEVVQ